MQSTCISGHAIEMSNLELIVPPRVAPEPSHSTFSDTDAAEKPLMRLSI
jgi:hypothetical protein